MEDCVLIDRDSGGSILLADVESGADAPIAHDQHAGSDDPIAADIGAEFVREGLPSGGGLRLQRRAQGGHGCDMDGERSKTKAHIGIAGPGVARLGPYRLARLHDSPKTTPKLVAAFGMIPA